MNIVKTLSQYNSNNVYFGEVQKNTVINNSNFMRLLYSTEYFSLNGIYLFVTIKNINVEKYFNKYKCSFQVDENKDLIANLSIIEKEILNRLSLPNQSQKYIIASQLNSGNIKMFSLESPQKGDLNVILKLSGIWDNTNEYGITYKFIPIS